MSSVNLVVLMGNLTRDPEVKTVNVKGKETHVANFSLATNRPYTHADGTKDNEVCYVDCEAWDSAAKIIGDYAKKGDPIHITGSLKLDRWESDGQKRSKLKVRCTSFQRLWRGPAKDEGGSNESETPTNQPETVGAEAGAGEGIPF